MIKLCNNPKFLTKFDYNRENDCFNKKFKQNLRVDATNFILKNNSHKFILNPNLL